MASRAANHTAGEDIELETCNNVHNENDGSLHQEQNTPVNLHEGTGFLRGLQKWWSQYISIVIFYPPDDIRDYLALERTFLAFFRTSIAIAIMSVTVLQVFALSDIGLPESQILQRDYGKPLAASLTGIALLVVLLGGSRYLYEQSLLSHGKFKAGGCDILLIFTATLTIFIALFVANLSTL